MRHAPTILPLIEFPIRTSQWSHAVLCLAAVILALDPLLWLINTWRDPSYDSAGLVVFAGTLGLLLWSATSQLHGALQPSRRNVAIGLLAISALIRLTSQVLAINTIGAICLIVDVYALGVLLQLDKRHRAVSPFWLAVTFAFSLPLERILQRVIGYPLQQLSADGACGLLATLYGDLVCKGTRLVVNGVDVMVDLPCSGAGTLLLSLLGFAFASTICRPRVRQALIGAAVTLLAAAIANVVRITALAVGLAEPERFGGINIMDQPWHDMIGMTALLIVCAAIAGWALSLSRQPQAPGGVSEKQSTSPRDIPSSVANDGWWLTAPVAPVAPRRYKTVSLSASLLALGLALVIVNLPRTAVDVAERTRPPELPLSINNATRSKVPLSARENQFFTQFGGWARKANYGAHSLMMVHTSSPLRHLHAPEDCLSGLGFDVQYLGIVFQPVPTAVYRATAPDGHRYRIDVTFVSDRGAVTTNVATAVWQWLQGKARAWTAIQRISSEEAPSNEHDAFNRAVWAALDISPPRSPPPTATRLTKANGGFRQ